MKIKYRRLTVNLPEEIKPTICVVCGRAGNKIDHHHYYYSYETKDVKKKPILVLDNTINVCFPCHLIADAVRITVEHKEISEKIRKMTKIKTTRQTRKDQFKK